MKTIRENAKKYFEEQLSGEPLYQDSVIDWLVEFAEEQIKISNEHWTRMYIKALKDLERNLNSNMLL